MKTSDDELNCPNEMKRDSSPSGNFRFSISSPHLKEQSHGWEHGRLAHSAQFACRDVARTFLARGAVTTGFGSHLHLVYMAVDADAIWREPCKNEDD